MRNFILTISIFLLYNTCYSKEFKYWIGDTINVEIRIDNDDIFILDTTYSLKANRIQKKGIYKLYYDKEFTHLYSEFKLKRYQKDLKGDDKWGFSKYGTSTIYFQTGQKKITHIRDPYTRKFSPGPKSESITQYDIIGNRLTYQYINYENEIKYAEIYYENGYLKQSITKARELIIINYDENGHIMKTEIGDYKFLFNTDLELSKYCRVNYFRFNGIKIKQNCWESNHSGHGYDTKSEDCIELK